MARNVSATSRVSPAATSTREKPSTGGAGGRPVTRTRSRTAGAPSAASRSRSTSSDRIASTAVRAGSDWRNTSLKTSSDSGPRVPGGQHVVGEPDQVEGALAGKEPVVAAPLQHVHPQPWRVGQLEEEQLLAGDDADAGRVAAPRQDVEAVQAQPERGVVGAAHDPPRVVERVDEPAPGECLVGDPQAPLGGAGGQQVQLLGGEVVVVHGVRRDRRAHQHRVGAELLHHVELVLGAAEVGREHVRRDRLEVAERLVEVDREAQPGAALADLPGRPPRDDQVVLEDLHAVETRRGDRGQLVVEGAGQADGGDAEPRAHRFGHGVSSGAWVSRSRRHERTR